MTSLMNFEIVTAEQGQPVTTSLAIAEGLDIQHKNVIAMVRKHIKRFEQFGRIAFQTRMGSPLPQGGFGRATEIAILNEPQASLLLTMQRNTERVMDFKVALVKAFFEARALINHSCMDLMQERAVLKVALSNEKEHASYHGKGLSDWRKKRDGLQLAIANVEGQLQPMLTGWDGMI